MIVNLPAIEELSDKDLNIMIGLYAETTTGAPDAWRRVFSDLSDALRVERARRKIRNAMHNDPVGFEWFGRLDSTDN